MKFWNVTIAILFLQITSGSCKAGQPQNNNCSSSSPITADRWDTPPYVKPHLFRRGQVISVNKNDEDDNSAAVLPIHGCCSSSSRPIGALPQMTSNEAQQILEDAKEGWNHGNGEWTQMTLGQRITAVQTFTEELKQSRTELIRVLMWEIGKNYNDAAQEFDRTMIFIDQLIATIQTSAEFSASDFQNIPNTKVHVLIRRNAFGIVLVLGPYNYPLNETYATLIPALLMGNVVILKIPQVGGLAHLLTLQAFQRSKIPAGAMHFITGSGRTTLPPLMESGAIDGLAFIGGTGAADKLIKAHPAPHRLKLFLQLEAKNMAIVLKDMLEGQEEGGGATTADDDDHYSKDNMLNDILTGALSYNGQRCTALKIVMVPKGYGMQVAQELAQRVEKNLFIGMPWETHNDDENKYSKITPLPNRKRIQYMQELLEDAISKGAVIVNKNGGSIVTDDDASQNYPEYVDSSNLMIPAILAGVTSDMRIYHEEQFGPLVPIVEYESIDDVLQYGLHSPHAQQVSIFTNNQGGSDAEEEAAAIIDTFSAVYGKININAQCGRSPDSVPFAARKSSGQGVMSIEQALREFSVPTVVSYNQPQSKSTQQRDMMQTIQQHSKFMREL